MRRVLRIAIAFEQTRCSDDQLALAYEHVVPTARRALRSRDDERPNLEQRAGLKRRRITS
jgi:hypothetical protein